MLHRLEQFSEKVLIHVEIKMHLFFSLQLIPLIDTVIKEPKLQNGSLFYEIADMLNVWKTKAEITNDDRTSLTFQRMLSNFWDGLSNICVGHVAVMDADEKSLAAVSSLLQILQNPENKMKTNRKKAVNVRFAEDRKVEINTEHENFVDMRTSNESSNVIHEIHGKHTFPLQNESLEGLVCKLAELSIGYTSQQTSDQHLKFLSALLSTFASHKVFQVLIEESDDVQYENPSIQFLHEKLIVWLKEDWRKETDFVVDILYSILHCCSSPIERENILNDLTKVQFSYAVN